MWKVTVNTPEPPILTTSATTICPGNSVTLTATNCVGIVRWPDQTTGSTWTGQLVQTTTFSATCEGENCVSGPSVGINVSVAEPTTPIISASVSDICAGQTSQLTASGCVGRVRWSDGGEGLVRSVSPYSTTTFRAVCQIGSCQSDSSAGQLITVRGGGKQIASSATVTNSCPFQTADLSNAIGTTNQNSAVHYEFRTAPSLNAPLVQSPGAALSGTYYVFGRDVNGCYTEPMAVTVRIADCPNAIPPCISNPATVAVRVDTLDWAKGVVCLQGKLGGSATGVTWESSGKGLFTNTGLNARYLLSETDQRLGRTTFTLTTADPDGKGPCVGALTQVVVGAPSVARELLGISKKVSEPVWVVEGAARLVALTYQLTATNLGEHTLTQLQVSDNLDAVFTKKGARVHSVAVRADNGLIANAAYTGQGADTTLLLAGSQLPTNRQAHIWLTVRVDVNQATDLTFTNTALGQAVDAANNVCRDWSVNGTSADPDQNGDPTDNNEPTSVTVHAVLPEGAQTVFIPEGFSPNDDGINDRFVIQGVPSGITIQLAIYNRWGSLVYQNNDYKNDWDGTANQGVRAADKSQGLPDGAYYYQIKLSDGREFVRFLTLAR
ncbi:gliding motility-associated C-terminal domain-containing protein [Spirosoma sp. RP8]|uniref:Gliding motility-associated C-terminal domain-containing protein n=1 Tax=Spirosoma liriopis TaxID=2937440 RepID=A0ABT0HJE4_9BACT|nr:gliding motility-associated C-terminal domain-containing protein [Spirosoma liriopis]